VNPNSIPPPYITNNPFRARFAHAHRRSHQERKSMGQADKESSGIAIAMKVAREMAANGDDGSFVFDSIMNQYVDRSAFARHYRASGDVTISRQGSNLRQGHLGDDLTEDEEARHKRMTAFNEAEIAAAAEQADYEIVELDAVSSIGSNTINTNGETRSQRVLQVKEKKITIAETEQMGKEEEIMKVVIKKEKVR